MVISNQTQAFVFSVVDATMEYNTKLITFFILFAFFAFSMWLSFKLFPSGSKPTDINFSTLIIAVVLRIVSFIFIALFPLYFGLFMYRAIAFEVIMRYIFVAYGIMFTSLTVLGFIMGIEKLAQMFGLPVFWNNGNTRRPVRRFRR